MSRLSCLLQINSGILTRRCHSQHVSIELSFADQLRDIKYVFQRVCEVSSLWWLFITHIVKGESLPTKTFKRISHFTQPHVYSLVVTHGRENAKHTVYRILTVRPEPEKENFTQFAEMLYMYLYARHLS